MALTRTFKEAVSTGNVRLLRIMMKDSMLNDPTFVEFNVMKNATQNLSDLYDTHDGRMLNYDKNTWDDSYMNELMVKIVGNFSHERVEHLQAVVKHLRPPGENHKEIHTPPYKKDYTKVPIAGAIIGAMAGGVIASVYNYSVVGGVIGGLVVGMVAVRRMKKGK